MLIVSLSFLFLLKLISKRFDSLTLRVSLFAFSKLEISSSELFKSLSNRDRSFLEQKMHVSSGNR